MITVKVLLELSKTKLSLSTFLVLQFVGKKDYSLLLQCQVSMEF